MTITIAECYELQREMVDMTKRHEEEFQALMRRQRCERHAVVRRVNDLTR